MNANLLAIFGSLVPVVLVTEEEERKEEDLTDLHWDVASSEVMRALN